MSFPARILGSVKAERSGPAAVVQDAENNRARSVGNMIVLSFICESIEHKIVKNSFPVLRPVFSRTGIVKGFYPETCLKEMRAQKY